MGTRTLKYMTIGVLLYLLSASVSADPMAGTIFEQPARAAGIEPALLYSVALAESAHSAEGGIAPWPWTLRTLNNAYYADSRAEAEQILAELLQSYRSIDVGMMQVNLRWNGHRVKNPSDLLDAETALRVAAEILREALDSAPGDFELGIGRYHNWELEDVARNYGQRILAIYNNVVGAFSHGEQSP